MRTRPDEWNHTTIKRLADARKVRVGDLVALKEGNDPFLAGRPGRRRWAEWFAEHFRTWQAGRPGEVAHLRRIHYWLVSLAEPVLMPVLLTGKHKGQALPYVNDEHSWDRLLEAGKDARYLGLVGLDELEDHRTPPATLYLSRRAVQPSAHLEGGIQGRVVLPWPHLALDEAYVAEQPVVVEVWIEKSTMDDVLLPICERYDVSLQTGVGQIGLEAPRLLVERAAEDGRPHVVLYISDFDSQGENMPVAVARKIEWMLRTHGADARIQLYPLALTKEQVERYTLPLLVSKDPDAARRLWEQEHKGTVELDALEALHPGELGRIVDEAVRCFRDPDLQERVDAAEQEALLALAAAERQARAEHAAAMTMAEQRLQEAWQAAQEASTWLARRLAELRPALPAVPEWDDYAGLDEEPLYDSERDYLYQNEYYQERKRKDEDAT